MMIFLVAPDAWSSNDFRNISDPFHLCTLLDIWTARIILENQLHMVYFNLEELG